MALESVWQIKQCERGGMNMECGPTCAQFLRHGGGLAQGAPTESGVPLTHERVYEINTFFRKAAHVDVRPNYGLLYGEQASVMNIAAGVTAEGRLYRYRTASSPNPVEWNWGIEDTAACNGILNFVHDEYSRDNRGIALVINNSSNWRQ